MIILILICAALLLGLLYAMYFARVNADEAIHAKREANNCQKERDKLRDKLIRAQRELAECQAELAEKKRALDYVCEANRRFAE